MLDRITIGKATKITLGFDSTEDRDEWLLAHSPLTKADLSVEWEDNQAHCSCGSYELIIASYTVVIRR